VLSAAIRKTFEDVIAAAETLPWKALRERLVPAMASVGFAFEAGGRRKILAARELDDTQRAVVEILADHPQVMVSAFPVPGPAWAKRRWLHVDDPGVLFDGEPTLYAQLRAAGTDEGVLERLTSALSLEQRVEVFADLLLLESDYASPHVTELLSDLTRNHMPTTMGDWGRRMAATLLGFIDKPWADNEAALGVDCEVPEAVLYALVRAGVPIEPAWERLLRLENYTYDRSRPMLHACIAAIPPERCERAIAGALDRLPGHAWRVSIALYLLKDFKYPAIVRYALNQIDTSDKPKQVLKQLADAAKADPAIARALAEYKAAQAPVPKLKVIERGTPALKDLDATERAQVELSAKRFDGRREAAADLLAGKGDEPLAPFERVRIGDARSQIAYDAWFYMVDSGTIFRAGTTDVIAEIVQDGLECDDKALRTALMNVIADKPKKRAAKKPAAKKRHAR
jgi:hypothetical protein